MSEQEHRVGRALVRSLALDIFRMARERRPTPENVYSTQRDLLGYGEAWDSVVPLVNISGLASLDWRTPWPGLPIAGADSIARG